MSACGCGDVFSIRNSTSSSRESLLMVDGFLVAKDLTGKSGSKYYADLELTAREKEALGEFVAQWSMLEALLQEYCEFLAKLMGDKAPDNVYSDSLRKRMSASITLANIALKGHADQAKVLKFLVRLQSISGQAHTLRHGVLIWSKKNRRHLEVHSRKNPHGAPWVLTSKQMEGWARKIAEMNVEFMWIHGPAFGGSLRRKRGKPLPAKHPYNQHLVETFGRYTGQGVTGPAIPQARKRPPRS
jgi:hypothetical protein